MVAYYSLRVLSILALFMAYFISAEFAFGQEYRGFKENPPQIFSQERYQGIKNSYEKTEQIMGDGVTKQGWLVSTVYADHHGRIRWEVQDGRFDAEGRKIPTLRSGFVFDGVLSCRYDYNYSVKNGVRDPEGKNIHAIIQEGTPFNTSWPASVWIANGDVLFGFLAYEEKNGPINFLLEEEPDKGNIKRITIPDYVSHKIVSYLDENTGGLEERRETYNQQQDLTRSVARSFKLHPETELWVTDVEVISNFSFPTEMVKNRKVLPPLRIENYVLELELNSPDFDESMLSIILAPGTFVHDTRYDVHYRVGDEKVIEAEINAAAQQAIAEQKEDPLAQPYNAILAKELLVDTDVDKTVMIPTKPEQSGRMLWVVIAVNVLVFVSLLLVFRFVRR